GWAKSPRAHQGIASKGSSVTNNSAERSSGFRYVAAPAACLQDTPTDTIGQSDRGAQSAPQTISRGLTRSWRRFSRGRRGRTQLQPGTWPKNKLVSDDDHSSEAGRTRSN